jgi:hypothetical protein
MAGFSSMDDFINEVTVNGKFKRSDWNKLTHAVTAHIAGEWHFLFHSTGNPAAATILGSGTNKVFQACNDLTAGAIPHGGNVDTDTKHLVNASAFSAAATTMPAIFMLVDVLGIIPLTGTAITTGASTAIDLIMGDKAVGNGLTTTFANATDIITHAGGDIPTGSRVRFTNSGGALPSGIAAATDYWTVRQSATTSKLCTTYAIASSTSPSFVDFTTDGTGTQTMYLYLPRSTTGAGVQTLRCPSTVMGAATPNILHNYTNSAGTTGKTTPTTLPVGKTAAAVGLVGYSGTGVGKYGPFMPLAAGDSGTRSVDAASLSASYVSGSDNIIFVKPLLTLPMTTIGVAAERDLLNQVPSLPKIDDGACLAWLIYAGAATPVSSAFFGHLDFAWG